MKKIIFSVIVALALTRAALPSEYREFTNQAGESIHARIVQYDVEGERVQLELKNNKQAWVQISDLSKEDQVYIQQYNQEKANLASEKAKDNPVPVKEISISELRAIGKQYIQAWESGSIEGVKTFFLHPENITQSRFNECIEIIDAFRIDNVRAGYIVLDVERKDGKHWRHYTDMPIGGWERWLLFTADGKIKYDSLLIKHPIEIALKSMPVLYDRGVKYEWAASRYNSNVVSERAYTSLKNMGIPTFGLDLSGSPNEIDESLLKMTEWLLENGDKWDSTDPKVFFPKEWLRKYTMFKDIR